MLGANGSGKSTLVRAALGLVPLRSGAVALFGTPVRRFRAWQRIGYVPQRLGAGSGVPATVREVVALRPAGARARACCGPAAAADRAAVAARWPRLAWPTGPASRSPRSPAASSNGR